ncbi:MAG: hypothetical protein FWG02_08995 [Holophagaceae bacterium]|nr:hypothetical protein [Holophagaceae bacterium]
MIIKFLLPAIISSAFAIPLSSQTDMEYNLARFKGNKIVLLGEWKTDDINLWNQIINADGIYGHGFLLLDRTKLTRGNVTGFDARHIATFERWFSQRYDLIGSTRWAALDINNKIIVYGIQPPTAKEFDQMLDRMGIRSPSRKLRDFLREYPDHLDAKADLLNEVRRRALHVMPTNTVEDLDDETDLRTWAVMAAETDKVFSSSWEGIDLEFFKPTQELPERYSKLMRNSFIKHIPKIESALRRDPANPTLWNIWAWMARSLTDYKWNIFTDSIDLFALRGNNGAFYCPSPEVCAWLIYDAKSREDWATVIKFADIAKWHVDGGIKTKMEWIPGNMSARAAFFNAGTFVTTSVYISQLEALLRIGDIDGANNVYDQMIRFDQKSDRASLAGDVASAVGMEELSELWKKGQVINDVPHRGYRIGTPGFYVFTEPESDYRKNFNEVADKLTPKMSAVVGYPFRDHETLGWKKNDGYRWGLFDEDGVLLAHDSAIPDVDILQSLLNRYGIVGNTELMRRHLANHGGQSGMELAFAYHLMRQNSSNPQSSGQPDDRMEENLWGEAYRYFRKVMNEYPEAFISAVSDEAYRFSGMAFLQKVSINSPSMKSLSRQVLALIEMLLEKKPSSGQLWIQWFNWRDIEGEERPIQSLLYRLIYSPLSGIDAGMPSFALERYYSECKSSGNWQMLVELLKAVWDREIPRIVDEKNEQNRREFSRLQGIGDSVGIPLIEAYLNESRYLDANEVFATWQDCGGKFTDISIIVQLAKAKGYEWLAREWEEKLIK